MLEKNIFKYYVTKFHFPVLFFFMGFGNAKLNKDFRNFRGSLPAIVGGRTSRAGLPTTSRLYRVARMLYTPAKHRRILQINITTFHGCREQNRGEGLVGGSSLIRNFWTKWLSWSQKICGMRGGGRGPWPGRFEVSRFSSDSS
jgi:hypothetical protein